VGVVSRGVVYTMAYNRTGRLACAGAIGVAFGMSIDRWLRWDFGGRMIRDDLPGLPSCATVSAATALQMSPPVTAPSTVLPSKASTVVVTPQVPPEPAPGFSRIAEIMRFGFPGLDNIRSHKDYVISYDRRNRVPNWVFEHLTKESVARNESVDRSKSSFIEDESIHQFFRSTNSDYKGSGFDRGHLAAAGNHRQSRDICDETFLLSNMSPQIGQGFNRDKWEHLERYVRGLTKIYRNVYVCTGPLYLPKKSEKDGKNYVKYQVIGKNNVAVPTHFFKVILGENSGDSSSSSSHLEMEAYVLPNQPIPDHVALHTFQVPPDAVERAAGLLFFDKLSRSRLTKINGKIQ